VCSCKSQLYYLELPPDYLDHWSIFLFRQVTGGSSGIGKALAIHAAELGANVTIVARNKASKQNKVYKKTKYCKADVSTSCSSQLILQLSLNHLL